MTDPHGSLACVAKAAKHRCSLELKWHGRGGRSHHLVFSPRGLQWVLGTLGIIVGALSLASSRAAAPGGIDAVLRENLELQARHSALRERAYDLAEQISWHAEREFRMTAPAASPGDTRTGISPPPGRAASDDAILVWLSDQGVRLQELGGRLSSDHDAAGGRRIFTRAAAGDRHDVEDRQLIRRTTEPVPPFAAAHPARGDDADRHAAAILQPCP